MSKNILIIKGSNLCQLCYILMEVIGSNLTTLHGYLVYLFRASSGRIYEQTFLRTGLTGSLLTKPRSFRTIRTLKNLIFMFIQQISKKYSSRPGLSATMNV